MLTETRSLITSTRQMKNFNERRRQKYIDEESYNNTLKQHAKNEVLCNNLLCRPGQNIQDQATALQYRATDLWEAFQLKYTAGEDLSELAKSLTGIVDAYERYVQKNEEVPDGEVVGTPAFDD